VPGRVNIWAGKFARAVALSFPEAASFYIERNVAVTGQPIRKELLTTITDGSIDYFSLDPLIKVLWVMGGSQGAQRLNDLVLDVLPTLLESFQVVQITGKDNYDDVRKRASIILSGNDNSRRHIVRPFLSAIEMARLAGISSMVISRAGSFIFEIALWGIPSILIPIPTDISRDQTKNAFAYARAGACTVIEERNATPHILIAEINNILGEHGGAQEMAKAALTYSARDAASVIAKQLIEIVEEHE
jgi:UDP-N-acetylglucosamine--N-acetylmuramyl-(pentapeptide) pyrophosphoryl-undecaprenol N-acetylglucosamine transferase